MTGLQKSLLLVTFLCSTVVSQVSGQMYKDNSDYSSSFNPVWKKGTSWTEKITYRKLALGRDYRAGRTANSKVSVYDENSSLIWKFKVTKIRKKPDSSILYRVEARNMDKKSREIAAFTFASRPQNSAPPFFSMLRGRFFKYFRGRGEKDLVAVSTLKEPPLPVLTGSTSIIHDFPVFPVNVANNDTLNDDDRAEYGLLRKKIYMISQDTGENTIRYALDITQKEYRDPVPDTFLWKGASQSLKDRGFSVKKLTGVQLSRAFDNLVVRQLWHKDYPWPLMSIGPWYKTELLGWKNEGSGNETDKLLSAAKRVAAGKPGKTTGKIVYTDKLENLSSSWGKSGEMTTPYSAVGTSPSSPPEITDQNTEQ